jgi:hypothetical protein
MKYISALLITLVALSACSSRRSSLLTTGGNGGNAITSDDCPNGMDVSVSLVNSAPSSLVTGQSISFRVTASGCKYGYMLYVPGEANPIRFGNINSTAAASTTFAKTYTLPQMGISETVTFVVLNARGQASAQDQATSQTFNITQAILPLTCSVEPSTSTITVPVNAAGQPVSLVPPSFSATARGSIPARVRSFTGPLDNYFSLSSATPVPSAAYASQTSIAASILKLSGGSYEFLMESEQGVQARCAGTIVINLQPVDPSQSMPQYLYRGDVNADRIDDIVSYDASSGIFWVAVGAPGGAFTYNNFGSLPNMPIGAAFLADFNGDMRADLLVRSTNTGMWKLGISSGSAFSFIDLGAWPANPVLTDLALQDINSDGRPDVVGNAGGVRYVSYISLNGATGSIAGPVAQEPVLTLSASPTNVEYNGGSTLNWSSENAASCKLKRGSTYVYNGPNVAGSYAASGLTANSTFTLECIKATTTTVVNSSPVTITVGTPPPPVLALWVKAAPSDTSANASHIVKDGRVHLRWTSSNISACSMMQGLTLFSVALNSDYVLSTPITGNTSFQLKCTSLTGQQVQTSAVPVEVLTDLAFTPANLQFGNVNFGATSGVMSFIISNPLLRSTAANIRVQVPTGFSFGSGGTCGAATGFGLVAGASCTYAVRFSPTQAGNERTRAYSSPVVVTYNNGVSDITESPVTLAGTGVKPPSSGK